jgi:3-oxoacyl-[acyl-carrier protein] reductase
MAMQLEGKVVLVTGGAGSIGFEAAAQLAEAGAAVVLNGRSRDRLEAAAERLGARAPAARVLVAPAELADFQACVAMFEEVRTAFGRLDGLVHSAVGGPPGATGLFEETEPASYTGFLEQSITTLLNLCRAGLPLLKDSGGGGIVAISSDAGKVAAPRQTMIGATRAAAMMFTRTLALEVSGYGIRCNCVAPTFVAGTASYERFMAADGGGRAARATARARLGLPTKEEVAALVVFLLSPQTAHLTGQVISVNGGLSAA